MSRHPLMERVRDIAEPLEDMEIGDDRLMRGVAVVPEGDCIEKCWFGSPDCRPGSGGWHGLWSRQLVFAVWVPGRGGATQTIWTPIETEAARLHNGNAYEQAWRPLGELMIHRTFPGEFDDAERPSAEKCYWTGGVCWDDCTYLQAEAAIEALVAGGVPQVWAWLAESWLPQALSLNREDGR